METETLLSILVFMTFLVMGELGCLIYLAWKIFRQGSTAGRPVEIVRESAAVPKERRSDSGRLRQKNEAAPKIPGLRICPRCYSAVNNELSECPACKNPLR